MAKADETHLASISDLKQRIRPCIEVILDDLVQREMAPLPGRMQECRRGYGGDGGQQTTSLSNNEA
jgi:hypothetical protein